jgi:hydrogenase nickel incorporation protein HypA/HybF
MHEMTLVRRLLGQAREIGDAHGGGEIREIVVEMGPLSGVEPELMKTAFELLREGAQMCGASLTINEVPLEARCQECGARFLPVKFRFQCPLCAGTNTVALRGDGVILESISLKQPTVDETPCTA